MTNITVGTKFKLTDSGLHSLCVDAFGPIDTCWDCDEMQYERKHNKWEITDLYDNDQLCSAKRVLPEGTKATIVDYLDDFPVSEFKDRVVHYEIAK